MKLLKFYLIIALVLFMSSAYAAPKDKNKSSSSMARSSSSVETIPTTTINGKNYYQISTCRQMVLFSDIVTGRNGRQKNQSANAIVMNEIDMSECSGDYPMIGEQDVNYTGTFDGQNYPIKGLKLTRDAQNVGLFGAIGEGAYLKNFIVQDVEIKGTKDKGSGDEPSIGGLVGWQNGGVIEGCYVSGTVEGTGSGEAIGGVVGNAYQGEIRDCYSVVTVKASGDTSFAGGIIGYAFNPCSGFEDNPGVTIYYCVFDGKVEASAKSYAGGIAGNNGERDPTTRARNSCKKDNWDHDYIIGCFYDNGSAKNGVGTGKTEDNESYPTNDGSFGNNYTKTGIPETFDMDSRHTICLLNGGSWNKETKTCEDAERDVWSGDENGISNGAGTYGEDGKVYYKITFDPNGGKFPENSVTQKNLERNADITADGISDPFRKYYSFKGWAKNNDATSSSSLGKVEKATNIYAVWESTNKEELTVVFNKKSGTSVVEDTLQVFVSLTGITDASRIAAIKAAVEALSPAVQIVKVGGSEDYTYTLNSWQKKLGSDNEPVLDNHENFIYEPTFTATLNKETLVVKYGSGETDFITVDVNVTDDDDTRIEKIAAAIESKGITVEKVGGDANYNYTYESWQKKSGKDSEGRDVYEPTFTSELKKETLVAKYGSGATEFITVEVVITDNDATRIAKIASAIESKGITIEKVGGDANYDYTYESWQKKSGKDSEGRDVYEPTFTSELKKETLVAKYGSGATEFITVEVVITDNDATRIAKIASAIESKGITVEKVGGDERFNYTYDSWQKKSGKDSEGRDVYEPTFTSEAKKETIVVKYGAEDTDVIEVEVLATDDDDARIEKIVSAIESSDPAIVVEKADADENYDYTHTGWEKKSGKDGEGRDVYEPTFTSEVKKATLIAKYGDGESDFISVVVLVTDDDAARIAKIKNAIDANDLRKEIKKEHENPDYAYVYESWQKKMDGSEPVLDGDGNVVYEPTFRSALKSEVIVALYGDNLETDVVNVEIFVTDTDEEIAAKIEDALRELDPTIELKKEHESADSLYVYDGWQKKTDEDGVELTDANGKNIYEPVFKSEVKKTTLVAKYGDGENESVFVEIAVTDEIADIIAKIEAVVFAIEPAVEITKEHENPDYVYVYDGWEKKTDAEGADVLDEDGKNIYVPAFKPEVRKDTLVAFYGDGESDFVEVVILATDSDEERIAKIEAKIEAENLASAITKEHENPDYVYVYESWQKKLEEGEALVDANGNEIYVPTFKSVVKKAEIVVVYGPDAEKDFIVVEVDQDDSEEERVEKIKDAIENHEPAIVVEKVDGSNDSTYTHESWTKKTDDEGKPVVDEDGNFIYEPTFTSVVKTETIVAVYGEGESDFVEIEVAVTDTDVERIAKIKALLEERGIVPSKAEDADSTYAYNGEWEKTQDGFKAVFESKAKFIVVIVDGDSVKVIKPEDGEGDQEGGDDSGVEIKVVVDGDTTKVIVSEGDVLEEATKEVIGENPTKPDTDDSTFVFIKWEPIVEDGEVVVDENGNPIYEPVFKGDVKKETIEVATGDGKTIKVVINVTDDDEQIQEKINESFEDADIPLPFKKKEDNISFELQDFVLNGETGIYEPNFKKSAFFKITFVMPKDGKLESEFKGYAYGEKTKLPEASITSDKDWEFKGWYTERDGLGKRVKMMLETDVGNKTFYPLFQKTVAYSANGKKGEIEVIYTDNAEKNILRALDRVIPSDYTKKKVNYTFDKWELENGVYVAKFVEGQCVRSTMQARFHVGVAGHALEISGVSAGAKVCVFDARGTLVQESIASAGSLRMDVKNAGRYIVRVDNTPVLVNVR